MKICRIISSLFRCRKMEKVRSFLLNENIIDNNCFVEYMNT